MKMMWNQTNTVNHHVFSDGGDNVDAKAVNVAAQNNEGRFTKLCKPVQKLQILEEKFEEEKKFSRTTSSTTVEWVKRGVKHFIAGS